MVTKPSLRERGGLRAAPFVVALVALALPATARAQSTPDDAPPTASARPAQPDAPSGTRILSGRGNAWRWSFVERATVARSAPGFEARHVARLSTRTPEGTDNLVLVLERRKFEGRNWLRVRLPMLPNNRTGWVLREALSDYQVVRTHLLIDRRRLRLRLQREGRTVFSARIGIGQRQWPTPAGRFYVRNELRSLDSPIYGPVAFGTSARSAVLTDWPGGGFIGIHGTNEPELLPGRVSHGCIRLRNRDILRLARLLPVGTPITIV